MRARIITLIQKLAFLAVLIPTIDACAADASAEKVFNVKEFGAVGNGTFVDTKAIQKAANAAYAAGGGLVVIPAGNYLSGALFFKNGVDLEIQEGATLISTVDSDDFPQIPTRFEGIERDWRCAFLNFDNSEGVKVSSL